MTKKGVNSASVGLHLDLTRQRVGQLADEGVFARLDDGSFSIDECRLAYIRWLRSDGRRASKSASTSRFHDSRAIEIEVRTAERLRVLQLSAQDHAVAVIDAVLGPLRSELQSVPARATKDLALRLRLESELNGVIDGAADRAVSYRRGPEPSRSTAPHAAAGEPRSMGKGKQDISVKRGRARAA